MYYAKFAISLWIQKVYFTNTAADSLDCDIYFVQASQIIYKNKIHW